MDQKIYLFVLFLSLTSHLKAASVNDNADFFERYCGPMYPSGNILDSWINPATNLGWHMNVEKYFQIAHFGTTDHNANEMNLCHIVPYKYIHTHLKELLENAYNSDNGNGQHSDRGLYLEVFAFIFEIFQEDPYANVYVPFNDVDKPIMDENNNPVRTMEHYSDVGTAKCYLNNNLGSIWFPPFTGPDNGPTLTDLNKGFRLEAQNRVNMINYALGGPDDNINANQRLINCYATESLIHYLHSAPANLRYGDRSMNQGIKDMIDPMGGTYGNIFSNANFDEAPFILTPKEMTLLDESNNRNPRKTQVYHLLRDQYNPEFQDGYYVKSSTGGWAHTECKTRYYVRCPGNDERCTKLCEPGQACLMPNGDIGICHSDSRNCFYPQICNRGEECTMPNGDKGICQEDDKTCSTSMDNYFQ